MLVECRIMLSQETIDEVHKLGGSLQYAIEDGLRVWLFAALRKHHERDRRRLAAQRARLSRQQHGFAKHIPTRNADGNDIISGIGIRFTKPFPSRDA